MTYSELVQELQSKHNLHCPEQKKQRVSIGEDHAYAIRREATEKTECEECGKSILKGQHVSGDGLCEKCNLKRNKRLIYHLQHRNYWWLIQETDTGEYFAMYGKPRSLIEKQARKHHRYIIAFPEHLGFNEEKLKIFLSCPKYPTIDTVNLTV